MSMIPRQLAAACQGNPERMAWLERLPAAILDVRRRWALALEPPWDAEASCAWVAPAVRRDSSHAVLKLGMPHMEGVHELHGLQFWDGEPTVRLLEFDEGLNAMLLERCKPGTSLRGLTETEQDVVIAALLRRLWRTPPQRDVFRPLGVMFGYWAEETMAASPEWRDAGLVRAGLRLFEDLPRPRTDDVVLATDLHAGNVLRAQRQPWFVIDPKPFVGDRAYDATQHLFNCTRRLLTDPRSTIRRFADLLEVDDERVRLWTFARAAAEPRDAWTEDSVALARALG